MPTSPDVAVHGGGLTGLTLGLLLARAGVPTTVVEPHLTPGSRDGLMAGLATRHQELQHHHVWRWAGETALRRYAAESARGQALAVELAAAAAIGVHRRPTATVTADGHEAFWLRHEARAERLVGLHPTFTDTTGLPMATRPQLILDDQPAFDVVAHRDALAEAFRAAGGRVSAEPVRAARRVWTTAYPPATSPAVAVRLRPETWTWLAFRAPDPVSRDVFHLDEGGRLVTPVGDELWVGSRRDSGEAWVARHFDDPDIRQRWEAPASATVDALPCVGRLGAAARGGDPDDLVACGFGPWELTLGTAAALQLAPALAAGSTDLPWAPARLPRPSAVARAVGGATRRALRVSAVTPFPRRG